MVALIQDERLPLKHLFKPIAIHIGVAWYSKASSGDPLKQQNAAMIHQGKG